MIDLVETPFTDEFGSHIHIIAMVGGRKVWEIQTDCDKDKGWEHLLAARESVLRAAKYALAVETSLAPTPPKDAAALAAPVALSAPPREEGGGDEPRTHS